MALSGRYDKNENFDGRFTPCHRLFKVAENNNIRLSYQDGLSLPSAQQQFINTDIGGSIKLIGEYDYF